MRYTTGLGIILVSATLLSGCNTIKGTTAGVEKTASGVGQTIVGTVVGAGKDIQATEKAITEKKSANYRAPVDTHNAPAG